MPFCLTNAPACVLAGVLGEQCLTYLDDIIVFSTTFQENVQRLDTVFSCLKAANLKLRPEKCHFAQQKVIYLGHVISSEGIQPDLGKVAAISNILAPKDPRQLKHFLRLSNYYVRGKNCYTTTHTTGCGEDQRCKGSHFNLMNPLLTLTSFILLKLSVQRRDLRSTIVPSIWIEVFEDIYIKKSLLKPTTLNPVAEIFKQATSSTLASISQCLP